VRLEGDEVQVDGEPIGELAGFRFQVDPQARHADRKLLLAAAERQVVLDPALGQVPQAERASTWSRRSAAG
jgi:hypothetical protein